jgi:type I restriction enzyme, S subunit
MGGEWQTASLGECVEVKHGYPFKGEFIHDEPRGDVLLTPGNFYIGGGFKGGKFKYYDGPVPDDFVLRAGDLVVTMTDLSKQGDTLGYPAFVPACESGRRYLHNQRIGKVQIKAPVSVDPKFLRYLLCSAHYRHEVLAGATGTTVKHTSPERIKRFRFHRPPIHEQRAIGQILGTLDDKIELNRRINETLEAIARALFKSWFVDFDPVRAKAKGRDPGLPKPLADLFPARLIGSELGDVPEGWEVGPILRQARLMSGGTPKTERAEYWEGPIAWASAKDVSQCNELFLVETERTITELGLAESPTQVIPAFCSVVVARGATTGRMVMFGRDMAMNQTCYALATTTDTPFALHCRLREEVRALVHAAHGSVFDTITTRTFESSRVVLPPPPVLKAFEERSAPLFLRVLESSVESHTLAALRDALLPKLISGELRVKNAEKFIGRPV